MHCYNIRYHRNSEPNSSLDRIASSEKLTRIERWIADTLMSNHEQPTWIAGNIDVYDLLKSSARCIYTPNNGIKLSIGPYEILIKFDGKAVPGILTLYTQPL